MAFGILKIHILTIITHNQTTTEYTDSLWNHAIGVGMEFTIHDVVGINLMTGYGSYDNFDYITFSGEFGVYYKF